MADPISDSSSLTLGLAIVAIGAVVTALRAIFGMRDEIRRESDARYASKETIDTRLDTIADTLEKLEHVHDCIHRLERKMDSVIERNRRRDNDE